MTAYATTEEYRVRMGGKETDAELEAVRESLLEAASRVIDRKLFVADDHFSARVAATFTFAGAGSLVLRLRDDGGLAYGLRTAASIVANYSAEGGQAEDWTLSGDGVHGSPRNNVSLGRPFEALELRRTEGPLTWPSGGLVTIEGAWGFEEVPAAVKELTIYMARVLSDLEAGGAAANLQYIDDVASLSGQGWRLWRQIERAYSRDIGVRR